MKYSYILEFSWHSFTLKTWLVVKMLWVTPASSTNFIWACKLILTLADIQVSICCSGNKESNKSPWGLIFSLQHIKKNDAPEQFCMEDETVIDYIITKCSHLVTHSPFPDIFQKIYMLWDLLCSCYSTSDVRINHTLKIKGGKRSEKKKKKKTRVLRKDGAGKYPLFIMEDRMLQITALQTIPCKKYPYFLLTQLSSDGNVTPRPRKVSESCVFLAAALQVISYHRCNRRGFEGLGFEFERLNLSPALGIG